MMADGRREEPDLNFLSSFPEAGNLQRRPGCGGRREEGHLLVGSHKVLLRRSHLQGLARWHIVLYVLGTVGLARGLCHGCKTARVGAAGMILRGTQRIDIHDLNCKERVDWIEVCGIRGDSARTARNCSIWKWLCL